MKMQTVKEHPRIHRTLPTHRNQNTPREPRQVPVTEASPGTQLQAHQLQYATKTYSPKSFVIGPVSDRKAASASAQDATRRSMNCSANMRMAQGKKISI